MSSNREETILSTDKITKKFGGLTAVNEVDVEIERGAVKTIIGPNGSGKTTFFNLITGVLSPSAGSIFFNGRDITNLPRHQRSQRGISRSYQITNIFPYLTTFENIRLSIQGHYLKGKINPFDIIRRAGDIEELHDQTYQIANIVGVDPVRLFVPATLLPHAEQRKLEIAMALGTRPSLLLLDEPTAGMSVEEIPEVINAILRVKERFGKDLTIILVEHKMDVVMRISEEIIVLSNGRKIAQGKPQEIKENKEVLQAYLGTTDEDLI
jgi:branched-chain amino acid transport system ATP-binding protein